MVDEPEYSPALGSGECPGIYSLSEFKEYLKVDSWLSEENRKGTVFSKPEQPILDPSDPGSKDIRLLKMLGISVQQLIRRALNSKTSGFGTDGNYVAQFWAPKVIGGRDCLATLDQPFAVGSLDNGSCWYRMRCMNHDYLIDNGADEEKLGPPGRVYRNGHPESSPDLSFYTIEQFPLRDHASRGGFKIYLALPVFDQDQSNKLIGVLELVSSCSHQERHSEFRSYLQALEAVRMRSTHWSLDGFHDKRKMKYKPKLKKEIEEMLELAIEEIPHLHLAQVWVPCIPCTINSISASCMEQLAFMTAVDGKVNFRDCHDANMDQFLVAGEFHNVQIGKGIAGKVLSSTNKLYFCRNLSDLSIIEYPLAHYAQKCSLSFCFSVCLQHVDNGNHPYIFEFYLHSQSREDAHTWSCLPLLRKKMEMKLKGFKVATGGQLGEEFIVEVCNKNLLFPDGQAKNHQHLNECTMVMPMERCEKYVSLPDLKAFLPEADSSCSRALDNNRYDIGAGNTNKEVTTTKTKGGRKKTGFQINLEDLKPHFGKRRQDAPRELGVSISTLKRPCRELSIGRLPSNKQNERNPSLFLKENAVNQVQDGDAETSISSGSNIPPLDLALHQNRPHPNTEGIQQIVNLGPEADVVILKGKI